MSSRRSHAVGSALLILCGASGCNAILGNDGGEPLALSSVGPADGDTVPGPSVTLRWSGGLGPYEVELAFDPLFERPVPGLSPRTTRASSLTVDGLGGGYFYWRVRCTACDPEEVSEVRELHVTCAPVELAEGVVPESVAMAWNDEDQEYGIVFAQGDPPRLALLRTDRLGAVISGPTPVAGMPGAVAAGQLGVVHVASPDRWAVVAPMEDGQALLLIDDDATVVPDSGPDPLTGNGRHDVAYHPWMDQIVTVNDDDQAPRVVVADGDRTLAWEIDAAQQWGGRGRAIITLPEPDHRPKYALVAYTRGGEILLTRIDLYEGTAHELDAPLAQVSGGSPALRMAWDLEDGIAGLVYTDGRDAGDDAHFIVFDPATGHSFGRRTDLNAAAPRSVQPGSPRLAWDGEELLVGWVDGRDPSAGPRLRLTRLDPLGRPIGAGDSLHASDAVSGPPAIVGHDRVHALAYTSGDRLFLCIEPPHESP